MTHPFNSSSIYHPLSTRAERGALLDETLSNMLKNGINIPDDFVVSKSDHLVTQKIEQFGSILIPFFVGVMDATVDFNNQFILCTVKIRYKKMLQLLVFKVYGVLTMKFLTIELSVPYGLPKACFGFCRTLPKVSHYFTNRNHFL